MKIKLPKIFYMKNIYVLFFFLICGFANAQIVNIPDANFKNALITNNGIDINNDGEIQVSEAEAANQIRVNDFGIVSMEGLEYFINIVKLYCNKNQIEILDISQNTKLEQLECYENQITTLDFTNNPYLRFLWSEDNPLQTLNVTSNPSLEFLYSHNCLLQELDVSNNPNLQELDIDFNQISTLDLSQNINLYSLYAWNNELISLNLQNGNNTIIGTMQVFDNPNLTCIQVDDVIFANSQPCGYPNNYNGWCKDETASYSESCLIGTQDFTTIDFQLFPNPTGNFLNIQSKENVESVKIYTTQGILIMEVSSKNVDVSQLTAGLYLIQITAHGKSLTEKFIKQ
ncbi:hypothetical protein KCTC32420_02300 [Aequorivita nionensis]